MSTNELKHFAKVKGSNKKPKIILCCDISIRNELAIGHENGEVSLWKLDVIAHSYQFLALINVDVIEVKQIEFNTLACMLAKSRGASRSLEQAIKDNLNGNSHRQNDFDLYCLSSHKLSAIDS